MKKSVFATPLSAAVDNHGWFRIEVCVHQHLFPDCGIVRMMAEFHLQKGNEVIRRDRKWPSKVRTTFNQLGKRTRQLPGYLEHVKQVQPTGNLEDENMRTNSNILNWKLSERGRSRKWESVDDFWPCTPNAKESPPQVIRDIGLTNSSSP